MKNERQISKAKENLGLILAGISILALLAGCTKSRDAEVKDEVIRGQIFKISELQDKEFVIETSEDVQSAASSKPQAEFEKPKTKIEKSTVPGRLQGLLSGLEVSAVAGKSYPVRFTVNKMTVNIFKLVEDQSELTEIERGLQIREKSGKAAVLLLQTAVISKGRLVKAKNENGEETSALVLQETDFEDATHVQISLNQDKVIRAGNSIAESKQLEEVFLADRLADKVLTLQELKAQLNLSLRTNDDYKVHTVLSPESGAAVELLIYKIIKKSEITDPQLLEKLRTGILVDIRTCPKNVALESGIEASDCVILLDYVVAGTAVRAELLKQDLDGNPTATVQFENVDSNSETRLVKFPKLTTATPQNPTDASDLTAENTIRVVDIKDKEFLMRRTFNDGASAMQFFAPGMSGDADLVRFELQKDALVVRKVSLASGQNGSAIDKEELMRVSVTYKRVDPRVSHRLVDATAATAQYAVLDWAKNELKVANSPLGFIDAGQCFVAGASRTTDPDNRLATDGVLNLTLEGTFTFQPECMTFLSYGLNDYFWDGLEQANYSVRERVSFMVHKGELDNKGLDLPFRAQNLLNFGIFTAGQLKPDEFNNTGSVETEVARPLIHDFSNGKTLTYHLGGVDYAKGSWEHDAIVGGTREVVADWNNSLRIAFKGTELEREGDYIILSVDGEDAPAGKLGDLDRHYIWDFSKAMEAGPLGVAQPAGNPRSGRIESSNVVMYSGNLKTQLGRIREMVKLQKAYVSAKQAVLDEARAQAEQEEQEAEEPIIAEPNLDMVNDPNGGLDILDRKKFAHLVATRIERMKTRRLQAPMSLKKANIRAVNMTNRLATPRVKETLQVLKGQTANGRQELVSQQQNVTKKQMMVLKNVYQKAKAQGVMRDELALQALSAAELMKARDYSSMPHAERMQLGRQSRSLVLKAEMTKAINSRGANCVYMPATLSSVAAVSDDWVNPAKTAQVFRESWKTTLAHEIGHALGLTHNFMGNVDKTNFLQKGEKEEKDGKSGKLLSRNYSSIMDYMADHHQNYKGPGVYDMRALRVVYTGRVEVHLAAIAQGGVTKANPVLKTAKGNIKVLSVPGSASELNSMQFAYEVTLADFKKLILGDQSWWKLDGSYQRILPLKPYAYCTDMHVGGDPMCNRYDLGTNSAEIAQSYIDAYHERYATANDPGNNINIAYMGNYIGGLFARFEGVRPFMDETFYRLMQGYGTPAALESGVGGVKGLFFFNQILRTPSAPLPLADINRYSTTDIQVLELDKDGNPVIGEQGPVFKTQKALVESKAIEDIAAPGSSDRVQTRGIEYDKAIATLFLTERGMGNYRYAGIGLRVSYVDFESIFGITGEESLTMQTLKSIISDNPRASVQNPVVDKSPFLAVSYGSLLGLNELPSDSLPSTSALVRYYALLGSSVLLDADSIEDKNNFASQFRVGASQKATPVGRWAVTRLGNSLASPTSLKLWASDNAILASNIIRDAAQKRAYIEAVPVVESYKTIQAAIRNVFEAVDEATSQAALEKLQKEVIPQESAKIVANLIEINKKHTGLLLTAAEGKALADANQIPVDKIEEALFGSIAGETINGLVQLNQMAAQIEQLVANGVIPVEAVAEAFAPTVDALAADAKGLALSAIMHKGVLAHHVLPTDDTAPPVSTSIMHALVSDQVLEGNHGVVVNNLEMMNSFFGMMYPGRNTWQ